jgi:hypothetical protein
MYSILPYFLAILFSFSLDARWWWPPTAFGWRQTCATTYKPPGFYFIFRLLAAGRAARLGDDDLLTSQQCQTVPVKKV